MKDDHIMPSDPNEILGLKAKIKDLEDEIDFLTFNTTIGLSILKAVINGKKINPQELQYLQNSTFEIDFTE
jgi:hypothetical protein